MPFCKTERSKKSSERKRTQRNLAGSSLSSCTTQGYSTTIFSYFFLLLFQLFLLALRVLLLFFLTFTMYYCINRIILYCCYHCCRNDSFWLPFDNKESIYSTFCMPLSVSLPVPKRSRRLPCRTGEWITQECDVRQHAGTLQEEGKTSKSHH